MAGKDSPLQVESDPKPTKANKKSKATAKTPNMSAKSPHGKKPSAVKKAKWDAEETMDDGEPEPTEWLNPKFPGSSPAKIEYTPQEKESINFQIFQKPEIWKDQFDPDHPAYSVTKMAFKPDNHGQEIYWKAIRALWEKFSVNLWPRLERDAFVITACKMRPTKSTIVKSQSAVWKSLREGHTQATACHPMILALVLGPECLEKVAWFGRWKKRYALGEDAYDSKAEGIDKENMEKNVTTRWESDGSAQQGNWPFKEGRRNGKDISIAASSQDAESVQGSAPPTPAPASGFRLASVEASGGRTTGGEPFTIKLDPDGAPVKAAEHMEPPPTPTTAVPVRNSADPFVDDEIPGKKKPTKLKMAIGSLPLEQSRGDLSVSPGSSDGSEIDVVTPHPVSPSNENKPDADESMNDVSQGGPEDILVEDIGSQKGLQNTVAEGTAEAVGKQPGDGEEPTGAAEDIAMINPVPVTPMKRKRVPQEPPEATPRPQKRLSVKHFDRNAETRKLLDQLNLAQQTLTDASKSAGSELAHRDEHIQYLEAWLKRVEQEGKQHEHLSTHYKKLADNLEVELALTKEHVGKMQQLLQDTQRKLEQQMASHAETLIQQEAATAQAQGAKGSQPDNEWVEKYEAMAAEVERLKKEVKTKNEEVNAFASVIKVMEKR